MNRVPTELWHEIFIKLDLKDRLTCLSVCRRWYDILDQGSLLHTLDISYRVFSKMKEMIEHQPHRATQVECLMIKSNAFVAFDRRILCNMFPNLREIRLPMRSFGPNRTHYLCTPFQFTYPISKLEKVEDCNDCEFTRQLVMSNMCNKLKSLEICFPDSTTNHVLSQLKNMPVLETFTLNTYRLKLMDLEIIHHNLPTIKRLCLNDLTVVCGEIPQDVVPAVLITELYVNIDYSTNIDTLIQFHKYLAKKYPTVKKPNFNDTIKGPYYYNNLKKIYNEGIFPLYQQFGTQIDTFPINSGYRDGLEAFRRFDEFGIKLKNLNISAYGKKVGPCFEELAQSQQSKYIQSLTLTETIIKPVDSLSNMGALTCLTISFAPSYWDMNRIIGRINFSQLIDVCPPTLTNVTISSAHLQFSKPTSNVTSIQCLKLINVELESETPITATSFPELSVLELDAILEGNLTISLPSNHLKKVSLHIVDFLYGIGRLSVNTTDGRPQRTEIWSCGSNIVGETYRPNKFTKHSKHRLEVKFTCASVEQSCYSMLPKDVDEDA